MKTTNYERACAIRRQIKYLIEMKKIIGLKPAVTVKACEERPFEINEEFSKVALGVLVRKADKTIADLEKEFDEL